MADILAWRRDYERVSEESSLEVALAKALAQRLRTRRAEVELTQEQVALRAGISRNQYQLYESALSDRDKGTPANPTLTTLVDLARALDCPVDHLLKDLGRAS